MSEELVHINENGGAGVDFTSRLFQAKPMLVSVTQENTQREGKVPGTFYIKEMDEQHKRLTVAMLITPKESRKYYIGKKGTLHKTPENLMCFAREPERGQPWRPDNDSKQIQAVLCGNCSRSVDVAENWEKYKETQDPNDVPTCDREYFAVFIDTVTQLPLKMYIGYTHRKAFEKDTSIIGNKIRLLNTKGLKPNLYDIKFDLYTEKVKNKNGTFSHVMRIDPKTVQLIQSQAEKEAFGGLYLEYINRGNPSAEQLEAAEEAAQMQKAAEDTDKALEGTYEEQPDANGEIRI